MYRIYTSVKTIFYKLASIWENPVWGGLLAFVVYLAYALHTNPSLGASSVNYHNYLADAFLHGQVNLRLVPPETQLDLSVFDQKFFLYWPPLPAILLMPFVAVFGVGFSDTFVTLAVSTLNVALVAVLFRSLNKKEIARLTAFQRSLLVLFFAFGTVNFTVAPYGTVWFTSSAFGFLFSIMAYIIAIMMNGRTGFFLAGLCVACAMMSRSTLIFVGLWPAYYLISKNLNGERKKLLMYSFYGILPVLVAGLLFLDYNWLRFGNPFELGTTYQNMAAELRKSVDEFGYFSPHYIKTNVYYQYIFYPLPETAETLMGGSLFLLSPVFFIAFLGLIKGRPRLSVFLLLFTILLIDIPILLNFGTGWFQFGPRYTLDFTVPLLILTAIGVQSIPDWLLIILSLISAAHFYKGMSILNMIWRR